MNSLHGRLALILCVAAAILLPAATWIAYLSVRGILIEQFDANLAAKAKAIIAATEADDDGLELDLDEPALESYLSPQSGDYFEIRRANGSLVARSPNLGQNRLPDFKSETIILPGNRSGRALRQTFSPVDDEERAFQNLQLLAASDSTELLRNVREIAMRLPVLGLAGLIFTLGLLYFALGRGLRPLDDLALAVQSIQVGKPNQSLKTDGMPTELRTVGVKLNELLERVQASIERERRFANHAAHELRTPLAELRSMVDLIATWPDEATPERNAELMTVILEMESLLEKLALISKTEADAYPAQLAPVNLRESVQAAIDRFPEETAARKLTFNLNVAAGEFQTDTVLWSSILNNLIGNAVSHAPAASVIHIEVAPGRLAVRNPAPDLNQEDVSRLFERFWRKSPIREGAKHSGLGLSIVQSCVQVLGGECKSSLTDGQLLIEISFA